MVLIWNKSIYLSNHFGHACRVRTAPINNSVEFIDHIKDQRIIPHNFPQRTSLLMSYYYYTNITVERAGRLVLSITR